MSTGRKVKEKYGTSARLNLGIISYIVELVVKD